MRKKGRLILVLMPRELNNLRANVLYSLLLPAHQTLMHRRNAVEISEKILHVQIFVRRKYELSNRRNGSRVGYNGNRYFNKLPIPDPGRNESVC